MGNTLATISKKFFFAGFSALLLIYLILPGPYEVNQFPPLPNSIKSELPGDTWQVPNIAGYFSNNYRKVVTPYYRQYYKWLTWVPFSPIRLNYPPETAFTFVKDQTQSTYLEEYVYPLRDSIFVNGFEPFYENGQPKYWGSTRFQPTDIHVFETKTLIRYYPSSIWSRLIVWLGINITIYLTYKLGKEILLSD